MADCTLVSDSWFVFEEVERDVVYEWRCGGGGC